MLAKRIAIVGLVLCATGTADASDGAQAAVQRQHTQVKDVALQESGVLVGQLLDAQGVAVVNAPVALGKSGKEFARVVTDSEGKFRIAGLTGGVHQVATAQQVIVCRLWAPQTAPPAAQRGLMVVRNTEVVRGQCGCGTPVCGSSVGGCGSGGAYGRGAGGGGLAGWMANHPLLTAGGIAAAIAVPLAVDDDDDPPATP